MSSILQELEKQIGGLKTNTSKSNVGVVREVGDGVAKIEGLSGVMLNEMIEFPGGLYGLALNLEESEVGAILLGDGRDVTEGTEVKTTGRLLSVPVGKGLLGRVVDTLGNPVDNKGPITATATYPVEKIAPGIIKRRSVTQPVQTGIMAIDAMIPIGRGQRELIIGDRATGKTTIAIDAIINQARINKANEGKEGFRPLYSIYVAIGRSSRTSPARSRCSSKGRRHGLHHHRLRDRFRYRDQPVSRSVRGAAMGEWFMDNGMDALIVFDDLSKHAVAYRQVSLVLKRPSGREAYPGDVFYLHSRLLERSARVNEKNGNGSLTALPIIETAGGRRVRLYPDERDLDHRRPDLSGNRLVLPGHPPGGVGRSLRVPRGFGRTDQGGEASRRQDQGRPRPVPRTRRFRPVRQRSRRQDQVDSRPRARIVELFKQVQYNPLPTQVMVGGPVVDAKRYLDDVAVEKIKDFQLKLQDYLTTRKEAVLTKIIDKGAIDDDITNDLKAALGEFKTSYR